MRKLLLAAALVVSTSVAFAQAPAETTAPAAAPAAPAAAPTEAAKPAQTAQKPTKKASKPRETREQKARRIAKKYGVTW